MAKGYIVVTESTTIHGVLLKANTYRVEVKSAVNHNPHLPIPIGDEIVYIKNAVNTMVPWPKHLVFFSNAKVKFILV